MTTQVIFTMDKDLKQRAMKKARSFGLPFSSVLNIATQAFVDGKMNLGITQTETLNAKTRRELIKISKDIKEGKNLSPMFSNAKDAIEWLKS